MVIKIYGVKVSEKFPVIGWYRLRPMAENEMVEVKENNPDSTPEIVVSYYDDGSIWNKPADLPIIVRKILATGNSL